MYYTGGEIADVIDLHGLRAADAEVALYSFINEIIRKRSLKALIIHGKGSGVLKEVTDDCLRQNGYVKKYYTAPLSQGGSGATLVEFSYGK
jgi:DNA mismatch repair protein MutS2